MLKNVNFLLHKIDHLPQDNKHCKLQEQGKHQIINIKLHKYAGGDKFITEHRQVGNKPVLQTLVISLVNRNVLYQYYFRFKVKKKKISQGLTIFRSRQEKKKIILQ